MPTEDPYAKIARWYDAEFEAATADALFYARECGPGRALVLGCGTGRICRALAPREVVGLDVSAPMVETAREGGGTYVVGDMRDFSLGHFDTIVIPNASFAFLRTRADRSAALQACRRALSADGTLWIDVPMPDPKWIGIAHTPEKVAFENADFRRTREVHRHFAAQRLELMDRYYSGAECIESRLVLHWFTPDEVEWMLEACGFYAERIAGDYSDSPLRDDSPRILIRASVI